MGETSGRIERLETEISNERAELDRNFRELRTKINDATDWRQQFDKHPFLILGAAVGTGLVLAKAVNGAGRKKRHLAHLPAQSWQPPPPPEPVAIPRSNKKALKTFDNIKGALVATAADFLRDFLSESVPHFRKNYERTERRSREEFSHSMTD